MEKEALRVWFDPKGDLLEVELGKPRKGFFRDLGDDVFPQSGYEGKRIRVCYFQRN